MADGVAITAGSGTTILTDDTGASGHAQVVKLAYSADGSATLATVDADGVLVNLGANNDVTVTGTVTANLAAGTNNIGDVDVLTLPSLPAGTNNIGDVDVLSVPAPLSTTGGGTEATALRVTIASDSTGVVSVDDNGSSLSIDDGGNTITVDGTVSVNLNASTNTIEVVGDIAHDTGVGGNPVQVAGASASMADSAPANRVSGAGDVTRLATSLDGAVFVHPHGPQIWSYHLDTSTAQTDASVKGAPGVGLSLYVTDIVISLGAATALNVFFEEGASKVLGPYYLEAINGRGMHIRFATPKKITANTALTVTTSASVAHCVDVTGFTAPG